MFRTSSFILLFSLFFLTYQFAGAQGLNKHFEIKESAGLEKIKLKVSTKAGRSYLNVSEEKSPLLIFGASDNDVAVSSFKLEKIQNTHKVEAELTCKDHMGLNFSESVAGSIFSGSESRHDIWELHLNQDHAFNLDLSYLMGEANVDLSRIAVERLKIQSASADVKLGYKDALINSVAMDTFFVKVDFGNIEVADLNCSRAKEIIAEVGFGSITIDCGADWKMNSKLTASVGAGNLDIILPPNTVPIVIKINDSPLCKIKMLKDFKEIGENIYGNQAYIENAMDGMEFNLDVGMGSIAFKERGK